MKHTTNPSDILVMLPAGVFETIREETLAEYSELERLRLINCIELARERHALQRLANSQRREHRHGDAATLCREADKMARLAREYAVASARQLKCA